MENTNLREAYDKVIETKDNHIQALGDLTDLMTVCYDEYYNLPPKVQTALKTITDRFKVERGN